MIQLYTFRTSKHIDQLRAIDPDLFIFGKLKEDLEKFKGVIKDKKITHIIGISDHRRRSSLETVAINKFNQGKVSTSLVDKYELDTSVFSGYISSKLSFLQLNSRGSDTFCNWTMYKICEHIEQNSLDIKVTFVHVKDRDFASLLEFLGAIIR